jgi:hypothetical protein
MDVGPLAHSLCVSASLRFIIYTVWVETIALHFSNELKAFSPRSLLM